MTFDTVPRSPENDHSEEAAAARRAFVEQKTGVALAHTGRYSFDPASTAGNIENFTGVAQMPLGFAGPLLVDGEHAKGAFYVPMATTEGTLVASYGRGMSVTRAAGGVKTTIVDDAMQRAPVFVFEDARQARDFGISVGWQMHIEDVGGTALADTAAIHLAAATPDAYRLASWLCHYHLAVDPVPGQGARNDGGQAVPPSVPGLGVTPDIDRLGAPVAIYE